MNAFAPVSISPVLTLLGENQSSYDQFDLEEVGENLSGRAETSSSVKEQPVVSPSGEFWDVGNVRLYRSTSPNVLLFAPNQLALKRTGERYQASLTQFHQMRAGRWQSIAGSALLVINTSVNATNGLGLSLGDHWRAALARQGFETTCKPVFLPLTQRNHKIQLLLEREAGSSHVVGGEFNGESASLMVDLTAKGADEWALFLRERKPLRGKVQMTFEYPQLVQEAETDVSFDHARFFLNPQLKPKELSVKLTLRAMAWIETTIEIDLMTLLQPLDESYLSTAVVDAETYFPIVVGNRGWGMGDGE
ncbi:MAG TPA: hypothetical protein VEF04_23155 [Blastocatellia bacterium]|nr:hypothetical protein [Blastocatellia bacterium]